MASKRPSTGSAESGAGKGSNDEGLHGVFCYKDPNEMKELVGQGKFVVTPIFCNTKVYCGHCEKHAATNGGRNQTAYYTYGSLFHHTRECQGWRGQMERYKRAQKLRQSLLKPLAGGATKEKEDPAGEGVFYYQPAETMVALLDQGQHVATPIFCNTKVFCGHCACGDKDKTPTNYTYTSLFHHQQKCQHWKDASQRYKAAQKQHLTSSSSAPAKKKAKKSAATITSNEEHGETESDQDDVESKDTDENETDQGSSDEDDSDDDSDESSIDERTPQERLAEAQAEKFRAEAAQIRMNVQRERMEAAFNLLKKRQELKNMGTDMAEIDRLLPMREEDDFEEDGPPVNGS